MRKDDPFYFEYTLETTPYGKWIAKAFVKTKDMISVSFGETRDEAGDRLKGRLKNKRPIF